MKEKELNSVQSSSRKIFFLQPFLPLCLDSSILIFKFCFNNQWAWTEPPPLKQYMGWFLQNFESSNQLPSFPSKKPFSFKMIKLFSSSKTKIHTFYTFIWTESSVSFKTLKYLKFKTNEIIKLFIYTNLTYQIEKSQNVHKEFKSKNLIKFKKKL